MKNGYSRGERRLRITLSLDAALVRRIEKRRKQEKTSRSAMVEQMLLQEEKQRKREALDQEIREYYRTMTPTERAEDAAIARAATKATIRAWKNDPDLAGDDW